MKNSLLNFFDKIWPSTLYYIQYTCSTGSFDDINDDIKVIQSSYMYMYIIITVSYITSICTRTCKFKIRLLL